ncbi:arabinogalactan oligomer / maltooligosaccharide transport system permease protein [Spiroplasma litorale]|uniref:Arabinogalactan oligomer / maltooligosaccharide transport system permease protein n=1 Tax=Spiroplasma litorale TaxID=216942 RepID=A0A0K1W2I7_9MOLU|nr:ABC transporter permease subunit [Spiroplasma litorale]AKX34292.1 arabinogalactan oligomer / maltooligosaccharide transport system permease protein [Spiroplasma litorale]
MNNKVMEINNINLKSYVFDELLLDKCYVYKKNSFSKEYKYLETFLLNKLNKKNNLLYKSIIKNNQILFSILDVYKLTASEEDYNKNWKKFIIELYENVYLKFNDDIDYEMWNFKYDLNISDDDQYKINEIVDNILKVGLKKYFNKKYIYKIYETISKYFTNDLQLYLKDKLFKMFIFSYEIKAEIKTLIEETMVQSLNLNENFLRNSLEDQLRNIINDVSNLQLDSNLKNNILKIFISIQTNNHKKTFGDVVQKQLLKLKASRQAKMHGCTSQKILKSIHSEITYLKKYSKFIGADKYKDLNNINRSDINSLIFSYKKYDKSDRLTNVFEYLFKIKNIPYKKYYDIVIFIKFLALYLSFDYKNDSHNNTLLKSKTIIENILKFKLIKFGLNDNELKEVFSIKCTDNIKLSYLEKSKRIVSFLDKIITIDKELMCDVLTYWFYNNEMYEYDRLKKNKRKNLSFINEKFSYDNMVIVQNNMLEKIHDNLGVNNLKKENNLVTFLTEHKTKLYLLDRPPLTTSGKIGMFFCYLLIIIWVLIIVYPISQVFVQAFNYYSSYENSGRFAYFVLTDFDFSLANFRYLFNETYFGTWLYNTVIIAIITTLLVVVLISIIGYVFSRYRFRGKNLSLMMVFIIQSVPTISSFIIFYIMYSLLQTSVGINGNLMLILIYTGGALPGNAFVLKGYMDNISREIDDAAKIDGCNSFQIYWRMVVPLAKPMLSIIALWSFIGPFGDVFWPSILFGDTRQMTVAVGLASLSAGEAGLQQGAYAAGALLVAVPLMLLFIGLQNTISNGMSGNKEKG